MEVVDMHCDTIGEIYEQRLKGNYIELKNNDLHLDIKKMQKGNYLLQNFAMFIDLKEHCKPYETLNGMIDIYYEEIDKNKEIISSVKCFKDIEENIKDNKISALLTIEEGGTLEGNLSRLQEVYDRGVRMITLTWNYKNGIGYPNIDMEEKITSNYDFSKVNIVNGLTPYGIDFLREMERLGIIVDVSHLGDAGFYDVLKYSTKPFVASHSNSRYVTNVARNMSDSMIRKLADKGGIMGINFCSDFIQQTPYAGESYGTIEDTIKHIKHIRQVGGIDCIGLGSDFDGISSKMEMKNGSYMPKLAEALLQHGFTECEIEKIFYKNVLRLYKELI